MSVIIDYSWAHSTVTPAVMKGIAECIGGIAYAGCNDTSKCTTKDELHALLDAGFSMGLVIENGAEDALQGTSVGTAQGKSILAAARSLGYDENCVLFGGADFNETSTGEYKATLAYMEAFAKQVPTPGYYGDSDSIDYLAAKHPAWIYWQSDSKSFSPKNPTPNASLLQLFNDPRAHGLTVDINQVLHPEKLPMMGNEMLSADDLAAIQKIVNAPSWKSAHDGYKSGYSPDTVIRYALLDDVAGGVHELQTALAAAQAAIKAGGVDPVALAAAITAHIELTTKP